MAANQEEQIVNQSATGIGGHLSHAGRRSEKLPTDTRTYEMRLCKTMLDMFLQWCVLTHFQLQMINQEQEVKLNSKVPKRKLNMTMKHIEAARSLKKIAKLKQINYTFPLGKDNPACYFIFITSFKY